MAYYAVAHLLQQGDMYGEAADPVVKPEQLTNEVSHGCVRGLSFEQHVRRGCRPVVKSEQLTNEASQDGSHGP